MFLDLGVKRKRGCTGISDPGYNFFETRLRRNLRANWCCYPEPRRQRQSGSDRGTSRARCWQGGL